MPVVRTACVRREIPWVCFSRTIFTACGTQQSVVHTAARPPIYSTQSFMYHTDQFYDVAPIDPIPFSPEPQPPDPLPGRTPSLAAFCSAPPDLGSQPKTAARSFAPRSSGSAGTDYRKKQ